MKKLTSLSAAAVTALVVGLGFATTGNAQTSMSSPMSDQEYCHVLADPTTRSDTATRFTWIEEALCETASLFALRSMAKEWESNPPYPSWREYSSRLAEYEAEHVSHRMRSLPLGARFAEWFGDRHPLLEADPYRRDDNTVIAKELLPIFETRRAAWRAARPLHSSPGSSEGSLAGFMSGWGGRCSERDRQTVESIARIIGAGKGPEKLT